MITQGHVAYHVTFGFRRGVLFGNVGAGTRFRIDQEALDKSLCTLSQRGADLYRISMAVYAADRLSRRNRRHTRMAGLARTIALTIEVSDPSFWRSARVGELLHQALDVLSIDHWEFQFTAAQKCELQASFGFHEPAVVCLYSGGLDSLAGLAARLHLGCPPVLAVTARHQPAQRRHVSRQLCRLGERFHTSVHSVMVRAALSGAPRWTLQESSQRCRSFLFASLGGCIACAANVSEIEVYENGVGVVNLPQMHGMLVDARATRSCHPRFLSLMSELISTVAERAIEFVLPFNRFTKGEVVRVLRETGLGDLVNDSVSCVHYPVRQAGLAKQCGYCPGCIGRRHALLAANVRDDGRNYLVDLFGDPERVNRLGPKYLRYLKAMIKQLVDIEQLRRSSGDQLPSIFRRHVFGTGVVRPGESTRAIEELLSRYFQEWRSILAVGFERGWDWTRWLPVDRAA